MGWDKDLKAVLHCYLTGQAGAGAVLDVVTGRVNPSGKLAETYPEKYEDTPSAPYYPAKERNSDYRESIFVGYRYFDTAGKAVHYPFGYGLSYTTFAYSDLRINEKGVSFVIKNTGKTDGAEVAQLYVGRKDSSVVFRAAKELKGFRKVFLKAGESKEVTIPFDAKTFRYWNAKKNGWDVESGEYTVSIGASVADIRLSGTIAIGTGDSCAAPYDAAKIACYFNADIKAVPDDAFAELLGYPVPDGRWGRVLTENDAICQLGNAKSGLARLVFRVLENKKKKADASGKPDLNTLFIYNMPFRAIGKMTGGAVDSKMVDGIVKLVNGHFFGGVGTIVSGYFGNKKANKKYEGMLSSDKPSK